MLVRSCSFWPSMVLMRITIPSPSGYWGASSWMVQIGST